MLRISGDKKVAKKSLRLNFWGMKCNVNLASSPVNLRGLAASNRLPFASCKIYCICYTPKLRPDSL